jgi:uncharacterized protein YndB with AHSA1/START domain
MRWVVIIVGAVIGLAVLITLVGLTRPKGHVARTRAAYRAPPEQLWATLTEFARWHEWNPEVKSVEPLPDQDGHRRMNVTGSWGPALTEIAVWEPLHRLETRMNAGSFRGSWTYELTPSSEGGTILIVTESGEVDNPVFRAMMIFMDMHATMMAFHRALAERTQDSVTPEKVDMGAR